MSETAGYEVVSREIGPMKNRQHVVVDRATGEAAVVDPAWDADALIAMAEEAGGQVAQVWLTHSHGDHVNALDALLGKRPVPVILSGDEADFWGGAPADARRVTDGATLRLGETPVSVIATPGHTPGGICFRLAEDLIAGDTLFVYGCGRCDLGGSDPRRMFSSLRRLREELPDGMVVHPGHDYGVQPTATMAEQRAGNPFLHFDDEDAFVDYRLNRHSRHRSQPFAPVSRDELARFLQCDDF